MTFGLAFGILFGLRTHTPRKGWLKEKGLFREAWKAPRPRKGLLKDPWKAPHPRKGLFEEAWKAQDLRKGLLEDG